MATVPSSFSRARSGAMDSLRLRTGRFLNWWLGELASLMPARWKVLADAYAGVPPIAFEGDEVVRYELRTGKLVEIGRVSIGTLAPEGQRMAVRKLLEQGEGGSARICIPDELLLKRQVWLPAATAENLRGVLGFEMDRHTPFRAEQVYFDFRVAQHDAERALIRVDFVAIPKPHLDALIGTAEALGVKIVAAHPRADLGSGAAERNLLAGHEQRHREGGLWNRTNLMLAGAALLLLFAALLIPIWQMRSAAQALGPRLEKARGEAQAVEAIRNELEALVTDHNHVAGRKHAMPGALQVLEEVSRALPDNTWVQVFELKTLPKQREVVITGETGTSSKLLETLEQGGMLRNANFRAALTKGQSPTQERFVVAAEVVPRKPPATVAESEFATAAKPSGAPASPATPVSPAMPAATPAVTAPAAAPAPVSPPAAAPSAVTPAIVTVPSADAAKSVAQPPIQPAMPAAKTPPSPPVPSPQAPAQAGSAPKGSTEIPEYFRQRPWLQYTPPADQPKTEPAKPAPSKP
jgi:general secretion pathway protein L